LFCFFVLCTNLVLAGFIAHGFTHTVLCLLFLGSSSHSLVPSHYASNPSLAKWVETQRKYHRLGQTGGTTTLTPTRQKLLEDEGFVWDVAEYHWSLRFEEYENYVALHGLGSVPTKVGSKTDRNLVRWIQRQRIEYKKWIQGKPSTLTESRLSRLRNIGFNFVRTDE